MVYMKTAGDVIIDLIERFDLHDPGAEEHTERVHIIKHRCS